jgi:hypothetical protein
VVEVLVCYKHELLQATPLLPLTLLAMPLPVLYQMQNNVLDRVYQQYNLRPLRYKICLYDNPSFSILNLKVITFNKLQ